MAGPVHSSRQVEGDRAEVAPVLTWHPSWRLGPRAGKGHSSPSRYVGGWGRWHLARWFGTPRKFSGRPGAQTARLMIMDPGSRNGTESILPCSWGQSSLGARSDSGGGGRRPPARHVAPPGCLAFFLPPVLGNADAQAHTPGDSDLTGPGCGLGICTERPQSF